MALGLGIALKGGIVRQEPVASFERDVDRVSCCALTMGVRCEASSKDTIADAVMTCNGRGPAWPGNGSRLSTRQLLLE